VEKFVAHLGVFSLVFLLILSGTSMGGVSIEAGSGMNNRGNLQGDTDFYFVHLTDTHVMSTIFEPSGLSKTRLRMALDHVCSFEPKPAFIVITGDLMNWGGSWISGALNSRAFVSCFYQKDGELYADANYSVPVYTTPGNHDYFFVRNLNNYHRLIEDEDRYIVNYSGMSLLFMTSGPAFFGDGAGLYDSDMIWLDHALDACNSSLEVVLMHHPAVNGRGEQGMMMGVLARNRDAFVEACETHHVELVLAGHTHRSLVYDGNESTYNNTLAINCGVCPTLFVQTDDCSDNINYRNVSVISGTVWLGSTVKIHVDDQWV
jgi:3',5'-cyclic AMP phosphodiesterase CpdA